MQISLANIISVECCKFLGQILHR